MAALIKNIPNNPKNLTGNRGVNFPVEGYCNIAQPEIPYCSLVTDSIEDQSPISILSENNEYIFLDNCSEEQKYGTYAFLVQFNIEGTQLQITCYGTLSAATFTVFNPNGISTTPQTLTLPQTYVYNLQDFGEHKIIIEDAVQGPREFKLIVQNPLSTSQLLGYSLGKLFSV